VVALGNCASEKRCVLTDTYRVNEYSKDRGCWVDTNNMGLVKIYWCLVLFMCVLASTVHTLSYAYIIRTIGLFR
jgi:hypothetical protein